MKKVFTLVILLFVCGISFGQTSHLAPKRSLGVVFSPGYISPSSQVYCLGLRGTNSLTKVFALGAEINYQQFLGAYGNSDAAGVVGFARITPFGKGLFTELGMQANSVVSSARAGNSTLILPYFAIGYQAKICKNTNMQFQLRPVTFNGQNFELRSKGPAALLPKVYLGLGYSF